MAQELRRVTLNLKSFDQDIPDPIVAGAADANGRTFRIIFDQEAEAQMTPNTKVYLSWYHKQKQVKGYNIFKQISSFDPIIWEISWPRTMLYEGDVLCCIELVDDISIIQSQNFIVHVLSDPNDGSNFVVSDDYSIFQQAVIELNSLSGQMQAQMHQQQEDFAAMEKQFVELKKDTAIAIETSKEAIGRVNKVEEQLSELSINAHIKMNEY